VHGAGRTDAGVHALAQVASVRLACRHDSATLRRAINAQLPDDVRVLAIDERPDDFHARFSARGKRYRYRIQTAVVADPFERGYAWHVPEPLDRQAMAEAAAALVGRHDFAAFQSAGASTTDTVRTITRSEMSEADSGSGARRRVDVLVYEVDGNGFLRHMVRAIVGTLVDVGRGRRPAVSIGRLLDGATRADAGRTAPPQGLFLVGVDYD
jgi:tRNA pseudouridine38-40 synthase